MTSAAPDKTALERAVTWLTEHLDECPRPIVKYVKQSYGLGNLEACEAIRLATAKRAEAPNG